MSVGLEGLLREVVALEASDLHIKAGVIDEETAINYAGIVSELKQLLRR